LSGEAAVFVRVALSVVLLSGAAAVTVSGAAAVFLRVVGGTANVINQCQFLAFRILFAHLPRGVDKQTIYWVCACHKQLLQLLVRNHGPAATLHLHLKTSL
jgi:hypothetical protein